MLSPPFFIDKPGNVYLYDKTNIGANSYLAVPNAKFIIKSHCSIAEGLTVHTGNHARLKGRFVSDITVQINRMAMIKTLLLRMMCGSVAM